jgi:hypothetical protein
MTSREWLTAVALGLIVTALLLIYFPVAMLVALASGAFAAMRELRWIWPVTVGVVAGLAAVVSDLVANRDLIGFHLAVTFTMCALAWSAWSITGRLIREDRRG